MGYEETEETREAKERFKDLCLVAMVVAMFIMLLAIFYPKKSFLDMSDDQKWFYLEKQRLEARYESNITSNNPESTNTSN